MDGHSGNDMNYEVRDLNENICGEICDENDRGI
jgi:hypothetical protein